jgi:hypothetical protein
MTISPAGREEESGNMARVVGSEGIGIITRDHFV